MRLSRIGAGCNSGKINWTPIAARLGQRLAAGDERNLERHGVELDASDPKAEQMLAAQLGILPMYLSSSWTHGARKPARAIMWMFTCN